MPRTPSPSRRRYRSRDRSREKERERDRRRKRSRSRDYRHRRSLDRHHRRDFSRSRSPIDRERASRNQKTDRPPITAADLEGKSPEEQEMMRMMGFCDFDTTKGKKVINNDVGEVHVILKRKYRQYMNRKGGFNRPLDFVA